MTNQKKAANTIGGKTARACDSCLKKRARWYCAADDAFLCQACDSVVHSANELASRHKRECLNTNPTAKPPPSWHQGFTKKARTPRNKLKAIKSSSSYQYSSSKMPVVPEVNNEDDDEYEGFLIEEKHSNNNININNQESDQMAFSVPNLDDHSFEDNSGVTFKGGFEQEDISNVSLIGFDGDAEWGINSLPDHELAEFAADVESLLEQDEEAAAAKGGEDQVPPHVCYSGVKLEEGDITSATTDHCCYFDWSIDVESEMFNFHLNHGNNYNDWGGYDQSQGSRVEEDENEYDKTMVVPKEEKYELNTPTILANNQERRILLKLNYEQVINAWASQSCSSPWISGRRPDFDIGHGWLNCMDNIWHGDVYPIRTEHRGEEWMGVRGQVNGGDGGREARVSRYREKRRTRLFTKKIRYQVRKLNAEKRPRLKGRFVKRTSLSQATTGVGVGLQSSFPYLNG